MPRSIRIVTPTATDFETQLEKYKNEMKERTIHGPEPLYTESETATILRTSRLTLRRWRINGTGPRHTKMGKSILYRASEIERYIEERTSGNETKGEE